MLHLRWPGRRPGRKLVVCLVAAPGEAGERLAASLRSFRAVRVRPATPEDLIRGGSTRGRGHPHVVLIDQASGAEPVALAAAAAGERWPNAPVILLSEPGRPGETARAIIESRAAGFVDKRSGVFGIAREILVVLGQGQVDARTHLDLLEEWMTDAGRSATG
jgi:DNA-binding NarL/FixJ family response regulator